MKRKWYVRVRRVGGTVGVEGFVHAESPGEAFMHLVRRKKVWPKRAYARLERFEVGRTYHVWPTWKVGRGVSLGDMWVARIIPEEEFGAYKLG
jgi:hypothetical protein